jgi:hypothetical protein
MIRLMAHKDKKNNKVSGHKIYAGDKVWIKKDIDFTDLWFVYCHDGVCEMTTSDIIAVFDYNPDTLDLK